MVAKREPRTGRAWSEEELYYACNPPVVQGRDGSLKPIIFDRATGTMRMTVRASDIGLEAP